jgi:hypothetical protein
LKHIDMHYINYGLIGSSVKARCRRWIRRRDFQSRKQ